MIIDQPFEDLAKSVATLAGLKGQIAEAQKLIAEGDDDE